jgi:protein-S-isoprenylcysteine O-methyltransferase Ste14
MKDLNKKAIGGLVRLLIILAGLTFLPAGTLVYWQAWIFIAVFFASAVAVTVYVMKNDPKLLERRIRAGPGAEKEKRQKIIQFFATIAFVASVVFPAIDHRFAWSAVPAYLAVTGDVLIALGFLIVFFVFKENTFASATIEVDAGQKVVSTGPYAIVRHPMYIGGLIVCLGVPLALGSWWGLLTLFPFTMLIVWRLLDEEKFLAKSLPGYSEYRTKVRYRLVPLIW